MNKEKIKEFFDGWADKWDEDMIRKEDIISIILDNAHIKENMNVLDVACGTGVLFEDYLRRGASVIGIDLSSEMVKVAKSKYPDIKVICGDVEEVEFDKKFDVIHIYNAFPHFPSPSSLINHLSKYVKSHGYLAVSHSMSKEDLASHHKRASHVSIDLLHEDDLASLMSTYFDIETVIANEYMYQVVGKKKDCFSEF